MTILQLILLGTHILTAVLFYKMGFLDGKVDGNIENFKASR